MEEAGSSEQGTSSEESVGATGNTPDQNQAGTEAQNYGLDFRTEAVAEAWGASSKLKIEDDKSLALAFPTSSSDLHGRNAENLQVASPGSQVQTSGQIQITGGEYVGAHFIGSQTAHHNYNWKKEEHIDSRHYNANVVVHHHHYHGKPPRLPEKSEQEKSRILDYASSDDDNEGSEEMIIDETPDEPELCSGNQTPIPTYNQRTRNYTQVLEGDELEAVANEILQSSHEIPHAKFVGVRPNNENVKLFAECLHRCKTVEIATLHVDKLPDIDDETFEFIESIVSKGNVKKSASINDDHVDVVVLEITPAGEQIRIRHCVITFPCGAVNKNTTFILRHLSNPKMKVVLIGFTRITPTIACTPSMTFNVPIHLSLTTWVGLAGGEHDTCSVFATVSPNEGNQEPKTEYMYGKPIENDHIQFSLCRFDVVCGGVDDKSINAAIVTYFLCTDDEQNFVSVCCLNNDELIEKLKSRWIKSGHKIIFAATDANKVMFDTELLFQLTCGDNRDGFKFDPDHAEYVSINKHFQEKKSDTVTFRLIVPNEQTLSTIVEFQYKAGNKDHPKLIKLPVTIEKDEQNGQKCNLAFHEHVTAINVSQAFSTMNSTEKNGITYTSSSLPKVPNHGKPV